LSGEGTWLAADDADQEIGRESLEFTALERKPWFAPPFPWPTRTVRHRFGRADDEGPRPICRGRAPGKNSNNGATRGNGAAPREKPYWALSRSFPPVERRRGGERPGQARAGQSGL